VHLKLTSIGIGCVLALTLFQVPGSGFQDVEAGQFVWHDLMTKDVEAAKRFYGELLGWRFENTTRGDRPYIVARAADTPVAGIVDVSSLADAGSQWLSFMAVADVDKAVALAQSDGGKTLVEPRDLPRARVAVVADSQGALLGLAQMRRTIPAPAQPTPGHFFWQEYLARDAARALEFYKRLAGYEPLISDSRLGVEYHMLRKAHRGAGLFQLPSTAEDVQPNWLPYVLVNNPQELAAKIPGLGGRVVVPASPEHRNSSLVIIADSGGAVLALQKYPF
jgi:predicted enzyme related to lactoylglutathione lyase